MSIEPNTPDRWKKNSTRAAILQAARRLAVREGPEAVTLGRVATEAGFAAPVVYAYFVSKEDLSAAVIADDLEMLTEATRAEMADAPLPADVEANVPPPFDLAQQDEALPPVEALASIAAEAAQSPAPIEHAPIEHTPIEHTAEALREVEAMAGAEALSPEAQMVSTAAARRAYAKREARARGISARLQRDLEPHEALPLAMLQSEADRVAAIARLEEAVAQLQSRPVNAWMERRLTAFEHTLADLEARMAACERDCAALIEAVQGSESAQGIAQAIGNLQVQEERQRAALADFRLYLKDLTGRLGAAEAMLAPGALRHGTGNAGPDGEAKPARKRQSATKTGRLPGVVLWGAPIVVLAILVAIGIYLVAMRPAAVNPAKPAAQALALPATSASADAHVAALAKAGNPLAQTVAGLKLLNGDGIATDIPSAVVWLGRAAAQHQPVAQYWLGTLFERGQGVPLDKAKAMYWYDAAANQGNAKAMYRLGVGYAQGWNGKPDDQAAAQWFARAAQLGVVDAQFNLAVLYEKGAGVAQSLTEALTWYAIAANQGDGEAKARVAALAKQLSDADVAAVRAAAAKFQPQTPLPAANDPPTAAAVAQLP